MSVSELQREDRGQSSVVILGMLVILLLTAAVVAGATAVNLEARKLLSAADGASSAAAQSASAAGASPSLSENQVRAAAQDYLSDSGAYQRFTAVEITQASTADGGATAQVELAAAVELPILSWVLPAQVTVTAESHARVSLNR
ncbi:pilus assembly protein TadG-related protein [Nesterenkonia cremea]|uniref:Flp pilus-assembly TadG-like N-terminal domain-containing protein n=1 Tax=Nesterenkonia cremea TaxID=1882340 RepID=A0A917AN37_9MICC|nr:hypothetical protein [Nesterenkonia cremea]GGE61345.1 hypothetical protein GCM10011401_05310 [Nesterenkonia cremea]